MAVFFALVTLMGWATGDIFITKVSRKIGSTTTYFFGFLVALLFVLFYIPFAGPIVSLSIFGLAIFLNIIHTLSNLAFFKGLEVGNASITATIAEAFPILTVAFSVIFFGEILTFWQLVGICLTLVGIFLASLNLKELKNLKGRNILSDKGIKYALVAFIGWGIYFAFVRVTAETLGWFWAGFPLYIVAIPLVLIKNVRNTIPVLFHSRKILFLIILFAILVTMGDFAYNLGILSGYTSVVAPITGTTPVLFVILSRFFFKDRLTGQQKLGIISSLLGIVLISLA